MSRPQKQPEWEPAWDAKNKKWFYQNRVNGKSSWDPPDGCTIPLPKQPPPEAAQQRPEPEECPQGWEAAWDPANKKWYYFNRKTEERKWTFKPKESKANSTRASRDEGQNRNAANATNLGAQANPQDLGLRGAGGAQAVVADSRWDAQDFSRRLQEARETRDIRNIKRVLKEVSESNYLLKETWRPLPRTVYVQHSDCIRQRPRGSGREPQITFSNNTTADAMRNFANQRGFVVCALNFANGSSVGGGYKNGAMAQEEDLCRRCPTLFTSLNFAKQDGHYPIGPATFISAQNPARYSDVLFTPNVVLARSHEDAGFALLPEQDQVRVSLITAAAPNVSNGREVFDPDLVYKTVESIFLAPKICDAKINTLILGAWGCGVFGCNPNVMSELFAKAIKNQRYGELYDHIHFAIPSFDGADENSKVFTQTMQKEKISFRIT